MRESLHSPIDAMLVVADRRAQRLAIALSIVLFAGLSLWGAITSAGFLEADGCTHYLYARFAFQEPHYFVNVWGRPICTAIYSIPALLGERLGVRAMSLILALTCAGVTYRIAKDQGYRWPALALMFTLAQPMVFLHSFSELTELPFATLLACAFWAYQTRRWLVMAILIALSPLSRPEGFGFLFLAAFALLAHRRWWWIVVLSIPLVIWTYVGWVMYGRSPEYPWWMWLSHEWPYAANSAYERGSLFHFAMLLPAVTSPILFPAMILGIWRSLRLNSSPSYAGERLGEGPELEVERLSASPSPSLSPAYRGEGPNANAHCRRCQFLIAILPLLILLGHSVLYWRGKMASSGELRYMLVVAPFWALLAAYGWEWIFDRMQWKHILRWAGVAALLPILINCKFMIGNWTIGYRVLPLTLTDDWYLAAEFANWFRETPLRKDYPYICASHPGVYLFLDISPSGRKSKEWHIHTIENAPPGTLLLWDPMYAIYNADSKRSIQEDTLRSNGWDLFGHVTSGSLQGPPQMFQIWRSPKTIDFQKTPMTPSQEQIIVSDIPARIAMVRRQRENAMSAPTRGNSQLPRK